MGDVSTQPAQKLIFAQAVEPLLNASRGKIPAETERALEKLGIQRTKKLDPAYPAETWAKMVRLISADLFPGEPADVQHSKLGKATVMHFSESMIGKAMFGVAKLMGPMRTLQRLTHSLRSGANFLETKFTVVSEREQELWINDVSGVPGFYMGLLGAGAGMMEGWPEHLEIKRREGAACFYQLLRTR